MPTNYRIAIAFALSFLFLSATAAPTAYEMLQAYDFPVGILPVGVTHYDLEESSGKFSAYFNKSCSFSLEGSYELKYKSRISGYIYKDRLSGISGVSVKVLFLWLNIVEVRRNGENLEFSVGIASADFPVDGFYDCPRCGCGLDCGNAVGDLTRGSFRSYPFVSSI